MNILKSLREELQLRKSPVEYFRSIGVKIGDGTVFYGASRSMFSSEPYLVKIGSKCHITLGVMFIPHDGSPLIMRDRHPDLDLVAPIIVGDRVFIGSRAIILAGVTIGSDCIIGAGSVVTKNVPSGMVVAGVPARPIKTVEEYERQAVARSVQTKRMSESDKKAALLERYKDILDG